MQWHVFSKMGLEDAKRLTDELDKVLAAFQEAHADVETAWCLDVTSKFAKDLRPPQGAKTAFVIDDPADLDDDPAAVSMLLELLSRADALAIDWGGVDFGGGEMETSKSAQARLGKMKQDPRVLPKTATKPEPTEQKSEQHGASSSGLADRVMEAFEAAMLDLERGVELKDSLGRLSRPSRAWLESVVRGDASGEPTQQNVRREVEAMLAELASS